MGHRYQPTKQYRAGRGMVRGVGNKVAKAGRRGADRQPDGSQKDRRRARVVGFFF
jgi:hypothetical protein